MTYLQLDLQFFSGEKTEKATPKKREDTRKKGQVAKSQDINTAIALFFIFLTFMLLGSYWKIRLTNLLSKVFSEYTQWTLTFDSIQLIFVEVLSYVAITMAPVLGVAMIAGIASNLMQIGFLFTTEPLNFKLDKINPISGFKRLFSPRAIVELVKSLLKISFVATVTFTVVWMRKDEVFMLAFKDLNTALAFFGNTTVFIGIAGAISLFIIGVLDYIYQRFDYEKNIRMSKQDIKDEYKNIEGDPLIKSKIKERQRQMAMSRMMSEVPEADVIITNPTHYAVAIKYDESDSLHQAPFVVAKGVDYVALKIREIANHHEVMIIENRPLARALYRDIDIGHDIDESYYQAVAEVLAYVYRLEKKA